MSKQNPVKHFKRKIELGLTPGRALRGLPGYNGPLCPPILSLSLFLCLSKLTCLAAPGRLAAACGFCAAAGGICEAWQAGP